MSTTKGRSSEYRSSRGQRERGRRGFAEKVTIRAKGVTYQTQKVIGQGSFGVVYQASVDDGKEVVAIKKVLQDKRFKVWYSFSFSFFFFSFFFFSPLFFLLSFFGNRIENSKL